MKLGFAIIAHNNFGQVSQLIDQLLVYKKSHVYIFIDAKSDAAEFVAQMAKHSRVMCIADTFSLNWGDASLNNATEVLLQAAIDDDNDYISLLSGADLCVRPIAELAAFLRDDDRGLYCSIRKMPVAGIGHGMGGLERLVLRYPSWMRRKGTRQEAMPYIRALYQIVGSRLPRRMMKQIPHIDFYFGSQWFTVSKDVGQRALAYLAAHPEFQEVFQTSLASDEIYFQTIFMQPEVRECEAYCVSDNLRYIDWTSTNTQEAGSPRLLTEEDIPAIEQSRMFFARKFNAAVDAAVVDYFVDKTTKRS
jgi:glycosyl transferase family 14